MITVTAEPDGDWAMVCDSHAEVLTCSTWADAYEAALGHACFKHKPVDICERKGHEWTSAFGHFVTFHGLESSPLTCSRCGEHAYEIAEVS